MLRYSLRRIPSALIVLAIGSVVIFTLLRLVPGRPARDPRRPRLLSRSTRVDP